MFKFQGDIDEMSYPFIYETSALCDFEILTDELCTVVGLAGSACSGQHRDLQTLLFDVQPKMFDLNGSVRGRCAIEESDIVDLKQALHSLREMLPATDKKFVLPRGAGVVVPLHHARSLSKKATRALVCIEREGKTVPLTLPRYTNVLTNLFFQMTRIVNYRSAIDEPEYISSNYGKEKQNRA